MAHIFDEFVKVAILRARPVEFLRFWREIQLYPGLWGINSYSNFHDV